MASRSIAKVVNAVLRAEGADALVYRSIGLEQLYYYDPFLLLDDFESDKFAEAPDHPHKGFETVTYLIEGTIKHEDFAGHKGEILPGGAQWMTAGRGIMHNEALNESGKTWATQLWINLSKTNKSVPPSYQNLEPQDMLKVNKDGISGTVIAGECLGVKATTRTLTPTHYFDLTMQPGKSLEQPIPANWNAFVYGLEGTVAVGPESNATECGKRQMALASQEKADSVLRVANKSDKKTRFLLIAGEPLDEPMVHHGPFVTNTEEEMSQAFRDYQLCQNGFEQRKGWVSDNQKRSDERAKQKAGR